MPSREKPDCQPSHFAQELHQSQASPRRVLVPPQPPPTLPVGVITTLRYSGTNTGDNQTAIL